MGWKNIKEHFSLDDAVLSVEDGVLYVGSGFMPKQISIFPSTGMIKFDINYTNTISRNFSTLIAAKETPELIKELWEKPDIFSKSIPVYTYNGSNIIQKQCEELDWPNLTHDGDLMYSNTFSTDRSKVIQWAKRNNELYIEAVQASIKDLQEQFSLKQNLLVTLENDKKILDQMI